MTKDVITNDEVTHVITGLGPQGTFSVVRRAKQTLCGDIQFETTEVELNMYKYIIPGMGLQKSQRLRDFLHKLFCD